jgi:hypothetical protein
VVLLVNREEMYFCRLIVHYVIRLLSRHPFIVTGWQRLVKGCHRDKE